MHDPSQPIPPDVAIDALAAALGFDVPPSLDDLRRAVGELDGARALAVLRSALELAGLDVEGAV